MLVASDSSLSLSPQQGVVLKDLCGQGSLERIPSLSVALAARDEERSVEGALCIVSSFHFTET